MVLFAFMMNGYAGLHPKAWELISVIAHGIGGGLGLPPLI
ncbi:hypothetical protein YPPY66_4369 [Yersinia pestis PY-66]|uniref:Uncharacterized protein n=2 Tax=Yersinia pseudotuberculosis complex TaxID=1649845 RepID=A0A0U1QUV1_YERP3|nr:hypothetical protein YpsIP31758_0467 [Yersinia pseudotuberculosis IP 31758]EDR63866.1 hypothetical protein YpK1973002_4130 [Yersinia pestis biovar Mediaevalis str. K1973002]EEO79344.1 hypothetical protein YPF_4274 [Yersinia pestis biovar Orientalis str. India 195]EIQ84807.1 hypothetical protein YPPY01_3983 [Yersinia pestis PY-01]EIQ84938.1 hypothetical protein YPPY02_4036 [Yersinia pestis PY-02]EIQ85139.1 hypothetical protein YPPY03_4105 [Yersinia pestis PY-03]EIQ98200.1 hypothetical prote